MSFKTGFVAVLSLVLSTLAMAGSDPESTCSLVRIDLDHRGKSDHYAADSLFKIERDSHVPVATGLTAEECLARAEAQILTTWTCVGGGHHAPRKLECVTSRVKYDFRSKYLELKGKLTAPQARKSARSS